MNKALLLLVLVTLVIADTSPVQEFRGNFTVYIPRNSSWSQNTEVHGRNPSLAQRALMGTHTTELAIVNFS
ncbi:hypothetical protein AKO1_003697, partial [Acrasis kona]